MTYFTELENHYYFSIRYQLPMTYDESILVTPPAHAPLAYGSLRYAGVR